MQKIRRLIKRGWFIIKYLKRILKIIGAIVGIFVLLVGLFFWYLSYSSPVNEAGRTFKKSVRSYRNDNLETVDDMYERLGVIHSHFNSPTHNKVQGGEKQTITHLDIETLFGTSHEVIEEVKLSNADTVYQYNYEDLTLNFHEKRGVIDEYVLEDFTETFYNVDTLDQFFIEGVVNHQAHIASKELPYEPIVKEDVSEVLFDQRPTRNIKQNGWYKQGYDYREKCAQNLSLKNEKPQNNYKGRKN